MQRFRERLRALGWEEGKNLIIEYRYAEGRDDRFPEFAAELVSMPVDVLVAWGSPEAIRDRVDQHLQAGADHVCIQVITTDGQGLPRDLAMSAEK